MNTYQNLTWDDLKAMIAETTQQVKETTQQMKESKQRMKESEQRMEKLNAESKQRMDEMNAKSDQDFKKFQDEVAKDFKELNRQIGGISKSNGDMAEEFFFNAFRKDKIFMNEKYDQIHKGYFYSIDDIRNEFDIVFINGKSIAIVEVKYKAKSENIDTDHLISRAERFKEFAPVYKNHKIYLGVAAMSFKKGLASDLHKAGIVTVHPIGKKMVIYDKGARVF